MSQENRAISTRVRRIWLSIFANSAIGYIQSQYPATASIVDDVGNAAHINHYGGVWEVPIKSS